MEVLHPICAGLDVHKDLVVACIRHQTKNKIKRELRRFGTTTEELNELFDWLSSAGVSDVVMEATGVYWRPVWRVLYGGFELTLANARSVKNVPGRKTDINDAQWLADLLAHGIVRPSFVPDKAQQERRDLTRTRRKLIQEQVQHKQRIQKVLETCNIKMSSVVTDMMGASGRAILDAIVQGEIDPIKLADLAHGHIANKKWLPLAKSLRGCVTDHDRFMLHTHLCAYDSLQLLIDKIDARLESTLTRELAEVVTRLEGVPGLSTVAAQTILAEVGADMSVFPTAAHLVSWVGLCPRMDESAGKRRNTRINPGSPWLKPVLIQAAWAVARMKRGHLVSYFHRLKARRGAKKAIVALAAKLLRIVYAMLATGSSYVEVAPPPLTEAQRSRQAARLAGRLHELGFEVSLQRIADG